MIYLIILTIIFVSIYIIYEPFIDIFEDYRGESHIVLWYNSKGERKFINIVGSQY